MEIKIFFIQFMQATTIEETNLFTFQIIDSNRLIFVAKKKSKQF